MYTTSEKIVNKALKILTYINDKKWNLKNDTLIVDYFNKLKDKEDLIHDTILNILQYGYIYENILYINKKQFKTINTSKSNKITLLHNYKHYKNINKILYHAKKEKSMITSNTQKITYKNDKENSIDLYEVKAFNDYISKNIEVNDLKLKYQKLTKRNISNNILKILNLSNKEKMIFAYRLQGVEYKTIAKVFNIKVNTLGPIINRINQKIEKIKNELYINYMK